MQNEIWKEYPANTDYSVSSLGRVKVKARVSKDGRELKGKLIGVSVGDHGYLRVNINKKCRRIHQLVAETFLGHTPCGFKLVVNHIDFNKKNNRVDNLEIVTTRENGNRKHLKSASKYVGVSLSKGTNRFRSRILINKKYKHLGYFDCELAASNSYQTALKELEMNGI
tara:strand:- start:2390 stop:2893 length:504 start_codon:yes stop_codon:yes gene_type:complete